MSRHSWIGVSTVVALVVLSASLTSAEFCQSDPVNNVDPLGLRAYGYDYEGRVLTWMDWIETKYTQEEVDRVYAVLAARDRHIFNTGLANTSADRRENLAMLQTILGVPVQSAWNPTFTRAGVEIAGAGKRIGRNGWSWNPVKMTGNLVGGLTEVVGGILAVAGGIADVAVAAVEKIPLIRRAEPTHIHSMRLYRKALKHVVADKTGRARVYGWAHSEGAIHLAGILDNVSDKQLARFRGYTFGAGGYMCRADADVIDYANRRDENCWPLRADIVPQLAGLNCVRRHPDIRWLDINQDTWWVHGFITYAEAAVIPLSKEYFATNVNQVLGY